MDDPNVYFGWTMISQPGGIRAPGDNYSLVGKEAADLAKQLTKDWHPRFKPLFEQMVESEAAFWKVCLQFLSTRSFAMLICWCVDHMLEPERRTAVGEQSSSYGNWRCGAQHDSCRYVFLSTIRTFFQEFVLMDSIQAASAGTQQAAIQNCWADCSPRQAGTRIDSPKSTRTRCVSTAARRSRRAMALRRRALLPRSRIAHLLCEMGDSRAELEESGTSRLKLRFGRSILEFYVGSYASD